MIRLIRLSIETGCVTGQHNYHFSSCKVYVPKCQMPAFSAAILLILVYLPGRPPYYTTATTVVGKLYSNSMVAMLNSRIKPVSNVSAFSAPLWNESVILIESFSSTERASNFLFRRNRTTDVYSSRGSDIATPGEIPV